MKNNELHFASYDKTLCGRSVGARVCATKSRIVWDARLSAGEPRCGACDEALLRSDDARDVARGRALSPVKPFHSLQDSINEKGTARAEAAYGDWANSEYGARARERWRVVDQGPGWPRR